MGEDIHQDFLDKSKKKYFKNILKKVFLFQKGVLSLIYQIKTKQNDKRIKHLQHPT